MKQNMSKKAGERKNKEQKYTKELENIKTLLKNWKTIKTNRNKKRKAPNNQYQVWNKGYHYGFCNHQIEDEGILSIILYS